MIEEIIESPKVQNYVSGQREWGNKARKRESKARGRLRNKIKAYLRKHI